MKKILFFSTVTGASFSGSEHLWYSTALNLLDRTDIRVAVCAQTWTPVPDHHHKLRQAGADLFLYDRRSKPSLLQRAARFAGERTGRAGLESWQRAALRFAPDLVVVSQGWWPECAANYRFLSSFSCPKTYVTHAASEFRWFDEKTADQARRLLQDSPAIFFVSEANRSLIELQLVQRLHNAAIVKNPIQGSLTPYPPAENGRFCLACVGRYHVQAKGQDILIRILAKDAWRARPLTIKLYGSGHDESLLRRWRDMFDLSSIEISGYEENISRIYEHCHGLILPSRHEGLPISALEAMRCGRIVIATKVGTEEVVKDDETGFLAGGPSVPCVEEALERAWT